jgi:hypothetical protein
VPPGGLKKLSILLQDFMGGPVMVYEGMWPTPQPRLKNIKQLKLMKIKLLLIAALIGAASLSAQARIHFGFPFGLPPPLLLLPPPPPIVMMAPVAPAIVAAPVVAVPQVVVTTPVYPAPVYPAPGYVWAPGYWSVCGYNRVWVPGGWHGRAVYSGYAHPYGWRR